MRFSVIQHAALAPALTTPEAWCSWSRAPFKTVGEAQPVAAVLPAMLRRRAGFLGKMAIESAAQGLGEWDEIPAVFCSRHGDVARSLEMLSNLSRGEPLSPTQFGLSVHNATAGLFSMARQNRHNHMALSAGEATLEHGVLECCSLIDDGAKAALLVVYDTILPDVLSAFQSEADQPYAWSWLITAPKIDPITLEWHHETSPGSDSARSTTLLPAALQVLQFFLSGQTALTHRAAHQHWRWSRHA